MVNDPTEASQDAEPNAGPDRWTLLRDALALQLKLVVDGARDFLLVPASIVAAVISLLRGRGGKPGPEFYQLLAFGKQTEEAIDLFGAYRHAPPDVRGQHRPGNVKFDDLVARVESFVVDEYRKGGVTAQAKERIDRALDSLQAGLADSEVKSQGSDSSRVD
jgi:hypothetical protein